jgi:hypothetical protein
MHSDLPHSTLPRADSQRSLLQLSLSSNELSFLQSTAFTTAARRPPADAAGRHRQSSPPYAAAGRLRQTPPPDAAAGPLMQLTASAVVAAGRQLSLSADVSRRGQPLLPPLVSCTVDSPCCHCLLVLGLVNSPCCYLSPVNSPTCRCRCSGEQPLLFSRTL